MKLINSRHSVQPGTVRLNKGILRLSPDLVIAKRFELWVDEKTCTLTLRPDPNGSRHVWYSNPWAKSAHIRVQPALDTLHLNDPDGVYSARVEGGQVVIDLKRRMTP